MNRVDAPTTERVARRTLAHYAKRCWWIPRDELAQIIATTVLTARRTFDNTRPWENYLQRALRLRIGDELLAMSSPVSARSGHRTPLRGHVSVEVNDANAGAYRATPEAIVAAHEIREHVRAFVLSQGFEPQIAAVILEELSYQAAQSELGRSTQSISSSVRRAVESLRTAPQMRALLEV